MQAAQERYSPYYRKPYYDLNLRPDPPKEPVKQVKPVRREKVAPVWDKLNIIVIILLSGIICTGLVVTSVYANEIQRTINRTVISTQDIGVEIDDIVVRINEGLDISTIELRAVEELGMIFPRSEQFVYIESLPETRDFAQYIRERAYAPFKDPPLMALRNY
jgi:cell division protein FtsL